MDDTTHYLYSLIPYFLIPSFIICDGINSFMQSTMVLSIRSLIQYLSKRTASAVHYANIVLAVKTCYKIKIDSRESKSHFRSFLASAKPLRQSRTGPPPSNRAPFTMPNFLFCTPIVALSYCNSATIAP